MFSIAGFIMLACFWLIIGLVGYVESIWMAIAVALPFLLIYRLGGGWIDNWTDTSDSTDDPTLNAFQQPIATEKTSPVRRQLPG